MKISIFQSDKGDCLLLTSKDGKNLLVDGGMEKSYKDYVRSLLGGLADHGEVIDLVCVSHIDSDHISGIIQLMDDLVDWRVFDYHSNPAHANRNSNWPKPDFKRPPEIKEIWHNAFHDQISENQGKIEDLLAASSGFLYSGMDQKYLNLAEHYAGLVTSKKQAIQLSRRISNRQLSIPLNQKFNGNLALVETAPNVIQLGDMSIYIIGPFSDDLKKLRKEWNKWLEKNSELIRRLRRQAQEDEERLLPQSALDLVSELGLLATGGLGDRGKVTPANLASLMFYIEENGKKFLLTGDGHSDDILKGLKHHKKLNQHGGIHVDLLKIQHHGSEHNTTKEFAKLVTADHYVFCGNGAHENPNLKVVNVYVYSRIGSEAQRSKNPEFDQSFKMWFNSTSKQPDTKDDYLKHMKKLEKKMKNHKQNSGGKLDYKFFSTAKTEIDF